MKSIMHNKQDRTCYLCRLLHDDHSRKQMLQEHHVVFGQGNRRLSEKYGLKVYLCIRHHLHDGGKEAVHRNADVRRMLDKEAQKAFEQTYPDKDFTEIFGKNYLDESDRQQALTINETGLSGFHLLEEPVTGGTDW